MQPNLFIVGAPKCGTASMHEYLKAHPQMFMSALKEPLYFGRDLNIRSIWGVADRAQYETLFSAAGSAKWIGESTAWYLYSKQSAQEIWGYNRDARIIIMLRNPIDAMYSLHGHFLWNCNEDIVDFETAIDVIEARREGKRLPPEVQHPAGLFYTDVYRYAPQLRRYLEVFGRERVHVILSEDMVADVGAVYKSVLEFLEIDETFQPKFKVINSAKPVSLSLSRFFIRRPQLRRLINRALPLSMIWRLARYLPYFTPTVDRATQVGDELRERLKPKVRADIEELGALLNRDLTHWSK